MTPRPPDEHCGWVMCALPAGVWQDENVVYGTLSPVASWHPLAVQFHHWRLFAPRAWRVSVWNVLCMSW
jgi:hypothetical protein